MTNVRDRAQDARIEEEAQTVGRQGAQALVPVQVHLRVELRQLASVPGPAFVSTSVKGKAALAS